MWKGKAIAATRHAVVTLLFSVAVYFLVFHIWYPGVFSQIASGTKLFLLIMAVEVILGPLMSLVIFHPSKAKRELICDYTVVVAIQLSAFCYGLISIAQSRPVFIVFVKDRIEVVAAAEIDKLDLLEAPIAKFRSMPWFGPKFICVRTVLTPQERERLLFRELALGKDVQHLPLFYRDCNRNELMKNALAIEELTLVAKTKQDEFIGEKIKSLGNNKWLPIIGKTGVWTAIISPTSDEPVEYIKFDPY